jgi:hypothetical protein
MTTVTLEAPDAGRAGGPEAGQLVRVRGQQWVVTGVAHSHQPVDELDEVLTPQTRFPGYFDLLVVDEVHQCAPPAPPKERGYAVDSKQTEAVRRLGEHSQHRLFLSATPHNGYPGSWQALLAMLDPQRFAAVSIRIRRPWIR